MTNTVQLQPRPRGFASMDAKRQREIAARGGRAAHAQGLAHKFSSEEARLAGRKGGESVSGNRAYMASIGRRGGEARHAARRSAQAAAADLASEPQIAHAAAGPDSPVTRVAAADDSASR